MSEQEMRELVVIEPEDLFQQKKFTAAQVREMLGKLEAQVEEKRLIAWANLVADTRNEEAKKAYQALCREQGRLMTAFARWRSANPEEEE